LYGGLGMNPFNPAMVGYVLLLISFPVEMTRWIAPHDAPSLSESVQLFFGHLPADGFTGATPLDSFRTWAGDAVQLANLPILDGKIAGLGWEWVNLAFLFGGLYLILRGIITWHIPVGVLAGISVLALPFSLYDSARYADVLFHLFSGATMLGAFFIATDPVTNPMTITGKFIFGAGTGALIMVIRLFSGYPEGVMFAVLLMNAMVPLINNWTVPVPFGGPVPERK
jgi:electron transport complex protein RnfD